MKTVRQKGVSQNKEFSVKRIIASIKYSFDGLVYAYSNEQSLLLHGIGTILVIIVGIFLKISFIQWSIILMASVVVLAIELLNTAIEATVDLITDKFHPLAKIAKDCGSAAAFVAAIAYAIICGFIFLDNILVIWG